MSILIRGMEMPKNCLECNFSAQEDDGEWYCPFTKVYALNIGRQVECPLVEVPPHGRLIDADVLVNEYEGDIKAFKQRINDFPQAVENNKKLSNAIDFRRGFITVLKHSPTIVWRDT